MSLHALMLGDDYPGTAYSLPDCVLDSERMFAVMQPYLSGSSELLRNEECTLVNLVKWVNAIRKLAQPGDAFVVYNSGHGTNDGKKQGIVLHGGFVLWEARIRELLRPLTPAVLISDSCFAGGLAHRYETATAKSIMRERWVPLSKLPHQSQWTPTKRMGTRRYDYFAACDTGEVADSTGDGGAFTNAILDVLRTATPKLTMNGIHARVRKILPNAEHRQTPQFIASDKGFARRTLGSFMR